jgi:drug/metabolite transporter superfamily protein YnfA
MFDLLNKYFWAIAAGVTLFNFRRHAIRPSGQSNGNSVYDAALYRRARAILIAPWLVMGIGIIFGGVPGVQNYLRPRDLNPYVWAWYCCVFFLACFFAYWAILRNGASRAIRLRLVQFPVFGRQLQMSERQMKVFAAVGPFWVVLWICLLWYVDVPLPTHPH